VSVSRLCRARRHFRTRAVHECFRPSRADWPVPVRHEVFRQHDGQILFRHRHVAAGSAVDDRNRACPSSAGAKIPQSRRRHVTCLSPRPEHLQVGGDSHRRRRHKSRAVVLAAVHADRRPSLSPYHSCPGRRSRRSCLRPRTTCLNRQNRIFFRERENRVRRAAGTPITAPSP